MTEKSEVPASRQQPGAERWLYIITAIGVLLVVMRYTARILGPFALILFVSIILAPVYARLRKHVRTGPSLLVIGLILVLFSLLMAGIITGSVASLLANLNQYQTRIDTQLQSVHAWLSGHGIAGGSASMLAQIASPATIVNLVKALTSIITTVAADFLYVAIAVLFLLADGPNMIGRFRTVLGAHHPMLEQLEQFAPATIRYFEVRTLLNALNGAGFGVGLWLLGIDYAPLWALLLFFLNYVPYIGIILACVPPVLIALADYGIGRAVAVVVVILIWDVIIEHGLLPRMAGRRLKLTAFAVYTSFFFWTWIIGPIGALLSVFLTLFALTILEVFPETRPFAQLAMRVEDEGTTAPRPVRG